MNGVAVEPVEPAVIVKTYRFNGCKIGENSVSNEEMLRLFDTRLHKASPAVASFILSIIFQAYGQVLQRKT